MIAKRFSLTAMLLGCVLLAGCGPKDTATGGGGDTKTGGNNAVSGGAQKTDVDLSTPKATVTTFTKALSNGDVAAAKEASIAGEQETQFLDMMASMASSMKKLSTAATDKFGADAKQVTGKNEFDLTKDLDTAEFKETGDTATMTLKDKPNQDPLTLKKEGGKWKVDVASMLKGNPQQAMAMKPLFDAMAKAAAETADEISAGKYKTAAEAKTALDAKMAATLMPKGPGGGMGGPGVPGGPAGPGGGMGAPPGPGGG